MVLADEEHVDLEAEELKRLARTVHHVTLDLPTGKAEFVYHYRLSSTIALAEIARQVGARAPRVRKRPRPPLYDRTLETLLADYGETVTLAELTEF